MTNNERVANIVAFFCIMFGEDSDAWRAVMELNPHYIIEKFNRYVDTMRVEYPWGLHPSLRSRRFHAYIEKWEVELAEEDEGNDVD